MSNSQDDTRESEYGALTPLIEQTLEEICLEKRLPKMTFWKQAAEISKRKVDELRDIPKSLPDVAPEIFSSRQVIKDSYRKENIVEFLRRVWKPWMDVDLLARTDLRRLDPSAEKAVENWLLRKHRMPPDINLLVCDRIPRKRIFLAEADGPR